LEQDKEKLQQQMRELNARTGGDTRKWMTMGGPFLNKQLGDITVKIEEIDEEYKRVEEDDL
jgi:hypothetical protein